MAPTRLVQILLNDDRLNALVKNLKDRTAHAHGMIDITRGDKYSEVIVTNVVGTFHCIVGEDETLVYFNLPSGRLVTVPKEECMPGL